MKRQLALFAAGLLALTVQGVAYSADSNSPTQDKTQQNSTDPQATPTERPASAASDKSNRPQEAKDEEAYQAKLKKCQNMSDAADKKACADKARKERGQM